MKRLTLISLVLLASRPAQLPVQPEPLPQVGPAWPPIQDRAYLANGAYVYAVRLSDGAKAWQYPPIRAGTQLFYSNPVLTPDGQLLVGSAGRDNELISLDPATGTEKWAAPFVATDHWVATPLVVGDTVYAANNDGTLYALKLATGQKLWSLPISPMRCGALRPPTAN